MKYLIVLLCSGLAALGQNITNVVAGQQVIAGSVFSIYPSGGGGGTNNLTDGLVGFWRLDEAVASGTRSDATTNGNDLTDLTSNVSSNATAIVTNSAVFMNGSATGLRHADNASLSLGADTSFTLTLWVNSVSAAWASLRVIIDKGGFGLTDDEFLIYYQNTADRFRFAVGNGTGTTNVDANTLGSPTTATWYFIASRYDASAQRIYISVNGGAEDSVAWTGGTQDTANSFSIGLPSGSTSFGVDALVDEVGYWKRALTTNEINQIYTKGTNGVSYPWP